jgi:predicted ATPase
MESLTESHTPAVAVWDDEHIKSLLHFPRFPIRLIQCEPWQSWIGQRGGLKAIQSYLQNYPFTPTHRRVLDVVLSNPESVSDVYADRLNISRATYFSQLRELVTAIAQALNHWELHSEAESEPVSFLQSNLPAPLTSLVGVEATLQQLTRLMRREDVRLLTLLGPGGIGKTRLSIELARRLNCEAYFVDLSIANEPSQVSNLIAQNLGIKENALIPDLKKAFRNHDFLLILDNFEQILSARTLISDLLTALPGGKIVVTSRASLQIYGEFEFVVPPLAIADIESVKGQQLWAQSPAVSLFVQRAQAANPAFLLNNENVEAVTELCQRMEGIPLAIELAAYQVKYFPPDVLLRMSKSRLDFLSQGTKKMPIHQQTMRAMLDWSFNLLSPELQRFFCRLSVFTDSFSLADLESVCPVKNAQANLLALIDQSLLEKASCTGPELRFRMLGIVREYAYEQLTKFQQVENCSQFQPTS